MTVLPRRSHVQGPIRTKAGGSFSENTNKVQLITGSTRIEAAGVPPKSIEEFVGRVNSKFDGVSLARMKSTPGWQETGQTRV